jgi:hypothetical protein
MLRSLSRVADSRRAASSVAELDGASPVSTENRLGQTAELRSAWTAGGGCPYVSISALANQLGTVSIRLNKL